MRVLTILLLVIPLVLQMSIILLLLRGKLQKRFFWFFVYVCYALFEVIIRLAVSHNRNAYFIVYWSTAIPGAVLTLLALWESFLAIFELEMRSRWFMWVFWICICIAVAYAGLQAWGVPPRQAGRLMTIILDLEFGSGIVIAMFGLFYVGAIKLFDILEYQRETAIIFGFTTYATMSTLSVITRSTFGTKVRMVTDYVPAIAYILAEVVWVRDLTREERKLPEPRQTLEQMRGAIEGYIGIVNKYLGRDG